MVDTRTDIIKIKGNTTILTLDEIITRYELSNRADGKSQKTISGYNDILMSFSRYQRSTGYHCDLSRFSIDVVREYTLYLRNRPKFDGHPYTPTQSATLSPQTLRCHTRGLKAFSTWLYLEGHVSENRLKNLKLPKAPIKLIEPLISEEIKNITSCINQNSPSGVRNHAIFVTALDNGLRASELAGVNLQKVYINEGYIKVMGKGAKERTVPIGRFVQMTLWHYISKVRPKPICSDCDNLFLFPNGKPITVNTIKLMFSRLAKSSGIKRLHAHLCRHTFAINYLLNGGDIFSLREILGHTTLEMVNHYLHFTSSQITDQHHKYSPMDKLHKEEA